MDISYLATPLLIISSLPQLIKMYKTKSSEGVSEVMFYLTIAGNYSTRNQRVFKFFPLAISLFYFYF